MRICPKWFLFHSYVWNYQRKTSTLLRAKVAGLGPWTHTGEPGLASGTWTLVWTVFLAFWMRPWMKDWLCLFPLRAGGLHSVYQVLVNELCLFGAVHSCDQLKRISCVISGADHGCGRQVSASNCILRRLSWRSSAQKIAIKCHPPISLKTSLSSSVPLLQSTT